MCPHNHQGAVAFADSKGGCSLFLFLSELCRSPPPGLEFRFFKFQDYGGLYMYFDLVETGKRIKEIRDAKGLTQIAFAEKINVSRSYINKIENGIKSPSLDLLIEIAVFGEVSLDYLILGRKPAEKDEKAKQKRMELKEKITIFCDILAEVESIL